MPATIQQLQPRVPSQSLRPVHALVFVIPAVSFVEFRLVGRLYLSELIFAVVAVHSLRARKMAGADRNAKRFLALGVLWLCSQVLSDVLRQTQFQDLARGWAKILFTIVNFAALYTLLGNDGRRYRLYAYGLATGGLLTYLLVPGPLVAADPWKFGIGYPITILVTLAASTRPVRTFPFGPTLLMAGMALVNFLSGFRSLGGICLITAVVGLAQQVSRRRTPRKLSPVRVAALSLIGLMAAAGTYNLYARAAESGLLGSAAQTKYSAQEGRFGVLLGGRTEVFYSVHAISQSPLLGYGSWSKAPADNDAINLLRQFGYQRARSFAGGSLSASEDVSAHSYVLGAWVESGLGGALFWFWVLVMSITAVLYAYSIRSSWALLATFAGLNLIWDTLFSPYGAQGRLIVPFYVTLILLVIRYARNSIVPSSTVASLRLSTPPLAPRASSARP